MKYVYLVRAGEDHYKVGVATNVKRRVANHQTSNGHKLQVITAKLVEDHYRVEREMHQYLKAMGSGGGTEWFVLDAEDALAIAARINDNPEVDVYPNVDLNKQLIEQTLRHKRLEKKLDQVLNTIQARRQALAPQGVAQPAVRTLVEDVDYKAKAVELFRKEGKASTSLLQRRLGIGYGRAARLMDELEADDIVGASDGSRPREVRLL